ncbi:hypothetical protein TNCV_619371 [Trichonephila clavipes]|nr:hypothetical protein TNCV_619371 [Trichonephila clavipes]
MSQRRRLPNLLRWRAKFQAEFTSYNTQQKTVLALRHERRRTTTACRSSLQTTTSEEESPPPRCENRLHNAGLWCKKTSCVFSTDDSEGTAYGKRTCFGRSNNGLLCCPQTSPDLQWRAIQGVY